MLDRPPGQSVGKRPDQTTASSQKAGIIPATRSPHSNTKPTVSSAFILMRTQVADFRTGSNPASALSGGRRQMASSRIANVPSPNP